MTHDHDHDHDHEHDQHGGEHAHEAGHEHVDEHADEWFRHTPDEPDAQHAHGEIRPGIIIAFLSAVIVATFGVAALFFVYFDQTSTDLKDERWDGRTPALAAEYDEKVANWNADLHGQPEWADPDQNFVTVPIDNAMRSVVDQYNRDR
jgi:hypothetical protein